jgi:hypothetical protein
MRVPLLAALLTVMLQACAPALPLSSGVSLSEARVQRLQPGNTSKHEVLELFGMPLSIAKKGEVLTVSRGSEYKAGGSGVEHAGLYLVPADTFFELFTPKHRMAEHHRIYYYYDAVSNKHLLMLGVYYRESSSTRSDQLWILINEQTGLVEDFVFRPQPKEAPAS